MSDFLCCDKKKDDLQKSILKNLMYCPYCDTTYNHNEFYKHYYDCKKGHVKQIDIHGDL